MADSYKKPQSPLKQTNQATGESSYIYPLTTADQVITDTGGRINVDIDALYSMVADKQAQHIVAERTLYAAQWVDGYQNVYITEVTPTNTVVAGSHPSNSGIYIRHNVLCVSQEDGVLTFSCDTTPTIDLRVNIMILN